MSSDNNSVSVKILDKAFNIRCPVDRVSELHEAAEYLDTKINELQGHDKVVNVDDLVMITALNVAHELLIEKKQKSTSVDTMQDRINSLYGMIENTLASNK